MTRPPQWLGELGWWRRLARTQERLQVIAGVLALVVIAVGVVGYLVDRGVVYWMRRHLAEHHGVFAETT